MRIGICGTFDVQNYGDLLFPLIAEAELSRRLGPIELHRFSYFEKTSPPWPYHVTSLSELPKVARELDGLLVGGGHLIRFDKNVAPGYFPPTRALHHPTGYWLTPALICLQAGCPVAWNAPGVFGQIPAWAHSLMHIVIGLSDYVAVRDETARIALAPFVGQREIPVVPDTCFGVGRLLEHQRASAVSKLQRSLNFTRPYFLVQATDGLGPFARLMVNHRERYSGYQIVVIPIGPALGDDVACLREAFPDAVELPDYPHPLLTAELIGHAAAVVGVSLHLSITAAALGTPMFRPATAFSGKYAVLASRMNVHAFSSDREISPEWFEAKLAERGPENDAARIV